MLKIKLKCQITHLAGIVDHVYVKYFLTIILKIINHLLLLLIISDSVIDWLSYLICYSNHLNSILRTTTIHCLILTLISISIIRLISILTRTANITWMRNFLWYSETDITYVPLKTGFMQHKYQELTSQSSFLWKIPWKYRYQVFLCWCNRNVVARP